MVPSQGFYVGLHGLLAALQFSRLYSWWPSDGFPEVKTVAATARCGLLWHPTAEKEEAVEFDDGTLGRSTIEVL